MAGGTPVTRTHSSHTGANSTTSGRTRACAVGHRHHADAPRPGPGTQGDGPRETPPRHRGGHGAGGGRIRDGRAESVEPQLMTWACAAGTYRRSLTARSRPAGNRPQRPLPFGGHQEPRAGPVHSHLTGLVGDDGFQRRAATLGTGEPADQGGDVLIEGEQPSYGRPQRSDLRGSEEGNGMVILLVRKMVRSRRRPARRKHGGLAAQQPGRRPRNAPRAPDSFTEDVRVPHRYNRLLLYTANMMHSATGYWGRNLEDKRMTAVFFWMAKRQCRTNR